MKNIGIIALTHNEQFSSLIQYVYTCLKQIHHLQVFTFSKKSDEFLINNSIENLESLEQKLANNDLIILENDSNSIEIATFLANSLQVEIFNNVSEITENTFTIKTFSGKSEATYEFVPGQKYVFVLSKAYMKSNQEVDVTNYSAVAIDINYKPSQINIHKIEINSNRVNLTDASIVVGAGRGLKDPMNWNIIEELADKLGAGLACSKPVSDLNWRPHHEHVGQTGIKISPKLYIAIGISGAIQHLAGVNGSETIIVINNDPEAPFVKNADYAIIGDLFQVVPDLLKIIN